MRDAKRPADRHGVPLDDEALLRVEIVLEDQAALEELASKKVLEFDDEKKAAMVSNLLVILCGDRDAAPVVNTGTLYH